MAHFGYTSIREMDARGNNKFSTKYYKQSSYERDRLRKHCNGIYSGVCDRMTLNPVLKDYMDAPLGGKHIRRDGTPYTHIEVLEDAVKQMNAGKDITESMVNRWNRSLAGTGHDIVMVLEKDLPPTSDSWSLFE